MSTQNGFLQDQNGNKSMMRFGVMFSIIISFIIIISGLVGWFLHFQDASAIIGAGVGLVVASLGAKGWQAQSELSNYQQSTQIVDGK
jgi:hypothetical protein